MSLKTDVNDYTKLYASNTVGGAITKPSPTLTEPAGDGVISNLGGGNAIALVFYGQGAADTGIGSARVTGWNKIGALWVPTPFGVWAITLGTMVGVSGAAVTDSDKLVDTIAASTATSEYTTAKEIQSNADNAAALLKVDVAGSQLVQVQLDKGTMTNVNALARFY